jgi:hypothetical protein
MSSLTSLTSLSLPSLPLPLLRSSTPSWTTILRFPPSFLPSLFPPRVHLPRHHTRPQCLSHRHAWPRCLPCSLAWPRSLSCHQSATRGPDVSCAAPKSLAPLRATPTPPAQPHAASSSPPLPRFVDPICVYQRRGQPCASARSCTQPPVYHPVAIHRDLGHIHPMVTRRAAGVLQPVDRLVPSALSSPALSPVSSSVRRELADPNWRHAMEYEALQANHTWDPVPRPSGANVVTGKWIFKQKLKANGSLDRYKARWVLRGFTQRPRVDYDETFNPVVKPATVWTVLTLALSREWPVHQFDVKNAFLHSTLTEMVYCTQPIGFVDPSHPTWSTSSTGPSTASSRRPEHGTVASPPSYSRRASSRPSRTPSRSSSAADRTRRISSSTPATSSSCPPPSTSCVTSSPPSSRSLR